MATAGLSLAPLMSARESLCGSRSQKARWTVRDAETRGRRMQCMVAEKCLETALKELEQIVEELDGGNLPLERSLELFEQGVRLSRECQSRLDDAERKVELLLKGSDGSLRTTPFNEPEE